MWLTMGRLLNESFIRQRSEELQLPFENLLAASILEEIVQRMIESEYADCFWMKNSARLSLDHYRRKVDLNLTFFIQESEKLHYKKSEISRVCAELFRNIKKDAVHWNYNIWMDWNIFYISLTAMISSVKVPVKIKLEHHQDEQLKAYRKDLRLITNNNKIIRINCFPSENVAAEKFLDILEKLELMNDLSGYMEIYEILKKEALSGRKVWELVNEGCKERGIAVEKSRFDLLLSYQNSSFMKKKWKAFLRHEKKKGPGWDEILQMIDLFFSVIWQHMCENLIYLGDWMPELGRYID